MVTSSFKLKQLIGGFNHTCCQADMTQKVTFFLSQDISQAVDGASLKAQLVENPPVMQETLVQFLGWEDLLEKE